MKKLFALVNLLLLASLVLTACGGSAATATQAPVATQPPAPATQVSVATNPPAAADLLATIQARGTLVGFTDPAYPPQSSLKANPQRTAGTKCAEDQKTLGELEGFDIDVSAAIAKALGVEPCFVSPDWGLMVSGNWSGRWDIAVGSMSITADRLKVLYVGQPYNTTPAVVYVHKDNTTYTQPADLSGKKIGVCTGCTYESYLNKTLDMPGVDVSFIIDNADIKGYDTDSTALEDLALGDGLRLDAVITSLPTGQAAIDNGRPIKQLGDPVFFEYLAPAFDKSSSLDPMSLIAKVNEIIRGMHADGSLKALSMQYFGVDLTSAAAAYDLSNINQ